MRPSNPETLIDAVERTGCEEENDAVLLCYAETKDWRKCKKELETFKKCIERYEKTREKDFK
jgi:cytochrome c oxidase assembly factor 4